MVKFNGEWVDGWRRQWVGVWDAMVVGSVVRN